MNTMDWNLARAFSATASAGSLSKAARKLGLTQPTLSRQIAALEAALGVTLFDRIGKRLVLTEAAHGMVEHVQAMAAAAEAMALAAAGRAREIEGTVTISASDGFAAYVLPEIVERIRTVAPQVTLSVVASNMLSDLRRREADIAIRHVRPDQPELIGRLVRESSAHFYASESWVAAHGLPRTVADLRAEDILCFSPAERFAEHIGGLGISAGAGEFRLVSESSVVLWELARRGLGVCMMLGEIAERTPGMVRLLPGLPGMIAPLWVVCHRELRTSRRCRLVFDVLVDMLQPRRPEAKAALA